MGRVSVINYSELFKHTDYRWDSEYLCFEPYKNSKLIYVNIGKILVKSQYGISIEMNEDGDGIRIYRMNEISNMLCNREVNKYAKISQKELEEFKLEDRDILFNRTNSQTFVGRTGIFRKFSDEPYVFASYLIRIRPNENKILPEYLTAFLNTRYGIQDVKRRARISINQSNVNAEELKRVEIPILSRLQNSIKECFDKAFDLIIKSETTYTKAQNFLLSELGLLDWQPKHQLTFVKNFSDTQKAERFDAEYFQPKYDDIVNAVKDYSGGCDILDNLVSIKKCIEVGSDEYIDEGIPFIRVSNLSPFEITEEKYILEELYEKLKEHQPKKGEILLSKDATPGIAYFINEDPKKMIPSGGILRLKKKDNRINEESLTLILNSIIVQQQIERDVGGSVILHWRPDQVKQTLIPILRDSIQQEIKQKITESFNLRKKSKQLLESAKRAVEIAIEQDEDTAIDWLNKEMEWIYADRL